MPRISEARVACLAATCLLLQGSEIAGVDPWQPQESSAWPTSPWSLQTQVEQGYAVFPCANYHIVFGDHAPGCKKRMPPPSSKKGAHERDAFFDSVHSYLAPFWRLPAHLPGSPMRTEVRVGATVSRSGSLANPKEEERLFQSLSHWAQSRAKGTGFCLSLCVRDDRSSKQVAKELYRTFADSAGEYDVDILLGPLSYELRDDAAFVADAFEKPIILWSYPSHFYTLGQGATRDRSIYDATMPVLLMSVKGTRWVPEVTGGAGVYVEYHQEGSSEWGGATEVVSVHRDGWLRGQWLRWTHTTELKLHSMGPVHFNVKITEGFQRRDSDPTNATAVLTDLQSLQSQRREARKLPLSQHDQSFLSEYFLEVELELRQMTWVEFYAQQSEKLKEDSATLMQLLKTAERSVWQRTDQPTLGSLKFARTGVFHSPSARMEETSRGNDQILESHKAEMRALAASIDEAPVQRNDSVWLVQGPCEVDESDCLTSPNYPGDYTNGDLCAATLAETAGEATASHLVLTDLDTELLHDMLWIEGQGRFYSGQDTLANTYLSDVGLVVWQSDISHTNRGWRLCILPVQDQLCMAFECPREHRPLASAYTTLCPGLCNSTLCCEPATSRSADGPLWDQGYRYVFDISVPQSQWLGDALERLYRAGARTIKAVVAEESYPQCMEAIVQAKVLTLGMLDWFEHALAIDLQGPDVLLVCGDAFVTTSLLSAFDTLQTHFKAILLGSPLGSNFLGSILPSAVMNYILEPLPWPSPEWMLTEFGPDFFRWCGWLLSDRAEPSLLSFQMQAVTSLLDTALNGLQATSSGYTKLNTSLVMDRLSVFQNVTLRTLMGELRFDSRGLRKGPVQVGTLQHRPLPVLQPETPDVSWNYWRARSLFSEQVILVNSTTDALQTMEVARHEVNFARAVQEDPLGVEDATYVIHTVLASSLFMPNIDTFAELTYPKKTRHAATMEVYPCPFGCERDGFACRTCPPGKFRSPQEEHCTECPLGRFSPKWAGHICGRCPPAAVCTGPPENPIGGIPGFWLAMSQLNFETDADSCQSDRNVFPEQLNAPRGGLLYLVSCAPLVGLCLGGFDKVCYGRNTGTLCRSCAEGDTWMHFGPAAQICQPCPSLAEVVFTNWMMAVLLHALICYVINRAMLTGSQAQNSITLPILRLVFEHSITEHLLVETLELSTNTMLNSLGDYLTRPLDLLAVDCLYPGTSAQAISSKARGRVVAALSVFCFGFGIILTIFGVRLLLQRHWDRSSSAHIERRHEDCAEARFRRLHVGLERRRLVQDALRHCLVWVYVTFPCILRAGIQPLVCMNVGLVKLRLEAYPDIECFDPIYTRGVRPLAFSVVLTYTLVVPLLFLVCSLRVHNYANTVTCSRTFGLMFQGFRRRFYWFEMVFIGRWVLQILCMAVVNSLSRALMLFVVLLGTQVLEGRCQPFLPLGRDSLRSAFRYSSTVHLVTLCLGLLQLGPDALAQDRNSISDYTRMILAYQTSLAFVISLLNMSFLLWVCYAVWWDRVVSPAAVTEATMGVEPLSRFQRRCVRVARFLHGINSINFVTTSDGKHFSLGLAKLRDVEREFLTQGMLSCVENLLWVRNARLNTVWLLEVLKASLDVLHKDHKARMLLSGRLNSDKNDKSSRDFDLAILHQGGELAAKAVSNMLGTPSDVGPCRSYCEVRTNFLVDEFVVALGSVVVDLQDSILNLTELEHARAPQHEDFEMNGDEHQKPTPQPFSAWQAELGELNYLKPQPFSAWQAELGELNYLKPRFLVLPQAEGPAVRSSVSRVEAAPGPGEDVASEQWSDEEGSLSEEDDETELPAQRMARLRRQIRELQVELRRMQVRWEMSKQSSVWAARCPTTFVQQHVAYALPAPLSLAVPKQFEIRGGVAAGQRKDVEKAVRAERQYAYGEEIPISDSECEFSDRDEELGISRGEEGQFTKMLGCFEAEEQSNREAAMLVLSNRSRWFSDTLMPTTGRELWFASFRSDSHSMSQSHGRIPRPPPIAPPPPGAKRVILLSAPGPLPAAAHERRRTLLEGHLQQPRPASAWRKSTKRSAERSQLAFQVSGVNVEEWWLMGGVLFSRL